VSYDESTNGLKSTTFTIKEFEQNSIKDICVKIKNLRRMPFYSVFILLPVIFYDKVFKELELNDVKVVGVIDDKKNNLMLKVQ
jgi:hypothetical protein